MCLETVEFAEAESPGPAVHAVSACVDGSAEMAATDALGPEEGHVVIGDATMLAPILWNVWSVT